MRDEDGAGNDGLKQSFPVLQLDFLDVLLVEEDLGRFFLEVKVKYPQK